MTQHCPPGGRPQDAMLDVDLPHHTSHHCYKKATTEERGMNVLAPIIIGPKHSYEVVDPRKKGGKHRKKDRIMVDREGQEARTHCLWRSAMYSQSQA
jgi:hypothetical protein